MIMSVMSAAMTDFDGYGSAVAKVRAGNNMLMGDNMDEVNELTTALNDKTLDESRFAQNNSEVLSMWRW